MAETITENQLVLNGRATDHIWGMAHEVDGETLYGLRVDCGDAGTLYLTKSQAHDVIDTLNSLLR
jgi:hypothetical protein